MKFLAIFVVTVVLSGQTSDPDTSFKLGSAPWATYYGDYSGRRFSPLSQINRSNVGSMTVAWVFKTSPAAMSNAIETTAGRSRINLTSVPIEENGSLYFTAPDHVWAVDALTGHPIWHFYRPAPGNHSINRGAAIYNNQLYLGTADAHVLSLDAHSGKKLWDVVLGNVKLGQAITMAPVIVHSRSGNRLLVGSSGDGADVAGFLVALDPTNGKIEWTWEAVPKPGQPGSQTWTSGPAGEDTMVHGGGNPSMTPTYDSELNLLYLGTGGPRPAMAGESRSGPNLYTCSIVALNADSGKMAWYFQASPHDTHNWDATQTPVLFDAEFNGKMRKLLAQASRNGYLFLLDRSSGESLVSSPFVSINWSSGVDGKGQPIPKKISEPKPDGVLVSPSEYGATSWAPPSYSPDAKLLYFNARSGNYGMFYMTSRSLTPKGVAGIGMDVARGTNVLIAIDPLNGKTRWTAEAGGLGGVLSTAGGLVFTSGPARNLVSFDAVSGKILWHSGVGAMANSAITYQLGGRQYIVTPIEDMLYAWSLPGN